MPACPFSRLTRGTAAGLKYSLYASATTLNPWFESVANQPLGGLYCVGRQPPVEMTPRLPAGEAFIYRVRGALLAREPP